MLSVFTIMLTNKLLVLLHIHPLKIYSTHLEKKDIENVKMIRFNCTLKLYKHRI